MKRFVYTALVVLLLATPALSQHNCPVGFQYAGTLSGTGGYEAFNERRELLLPDEPAKSPN